MTGGFSSAARSVGTPLSSSGPTSSSDRLNSVSVAEAAGGGVGDIVRLTWYVTDKREYVARQREMGEAYRRVMGRHFPAMTMVVVAGLIEDRALVEIEATAVLQQAAR